MKIAHYLNHTNKANGHVAVAIDLACDQAAQGHDVYMVSSGGAFDSLLKAHGVTVVHTKAPRGPLRPALMAVDLVAKMRRIRPDVVNAHMVAAAVSAYLVRPFAGYAIVTTVHNSFDRQARLMGVGNKVIAVSEAVREQMRRLGTPDTKLHTVTNGTIGGARRSYLPKTEMPLQHPAVVCVAGLHARKGIDHLIDAFDMVRKKHPDAHLYLVGEGPESASYEARAAASGNQDNIHFLGFMEDPREVLATADIFALASLRDPFPLVLSEARQMGNAIVATNVDGIPEALDHGRRGLLVPPADPVALADALERLITDDGLRARMKAASLADLEEITVRRMSERTLAVYEEAIASRR
jgi:glycosyltransferase involved in cell wall biosynthesis